MINNVKTLPKNEPIIQNKTVNSNIMPSTAISFEKITLNSFQKSNARRWKKFLGNYGCAIHVNYRHNLLQYLLNPLFKVKIPVFFVIISCLTFSSAPAQKKPTPEDKYFRTARQLEQNGSYEEALGLYRMLYRQQPRNIIFLQGGMSGSRKSKGNAAITLTSGVFVMFNWKSPVFKW